MEDIALLLLWLLWLFVDSKTGGLPRGNDTAAWGGEGRIQELESRMVTSCSMVVGVPGVVVGGGGGISKISILTNDADSLSIIPFACVQSVFCATRQVLDVGRGRLSTGGLVGSFKKENEECIST